MPSHAPVFFPHAKVTEIDFGTTPVADTVFTITDAQCSTSSLVLCWPDYTAATGKDLDECEMDQLETIAGTPQNGSFSLYVRARDSSYLADKFRVKYILN